MTVRAALVLATVALAGCQSIGGGNAPFDAGEARVLAAGLSDAMGRCWFAETETAFAGYVYTPEHVGGKPRILVVSKDDPGGRPALVVEPRNRHSVDIYGPLAQSTLGPRISADIARWRSGGTGCGT